VVAALTRSPSALRNLITSAGATFATTAANSNQLAATFRVFPTFLNETKATFARLKLFAIDTDPLVNALVPVAQQLVPTLSAVQVLSPSLRTLFLDLDPLVTASETGFPAFRQVLLGAEPLLGALAPFLGQLNPILTWLSQHQQLTGDFLSNLPSGIAAKTSSFSGGTGHYLRQFQPIGPETLSINANRNPENRGNT